MSTSIIKRINSLFVRKQAIICHSADDMERRADMLLLEGFQVAMEIGVQPVQPYCFPTYRVVFWK